MASFLLNKSAGLGEASAGRPPPGGEARLIVADREKTFILSGAGDVIEPDHSIAAVGSRGSYTLAAARALMTHTQLTAREVATHAMQIAADVCIYTNSNVTIEELCGMAP